MKCATALFSAIRCISGMSSQRGRLQMSRPTSTKWLPIPIVRRGVVLNRQGRPGALGRPKARRLGRQRSAIAPCAVFDRLGGVQDRVDVLACFEPALRDLTLRHAFVRCPDRLSAVVIWDLAESRFDQLGRRREVRRELIEADRLDRLHEHEGRRQVMREVAAERQPSSRSRFGSETSEVGTDDAAAPSSPAACFFVRSSNTKTSATPVDFIMIVTIAKRDPFLTIALTLLAPDPSQTVAIALTTFAAWETGRPVDRNAVSIASRREAANQGLTVSSRRRLSASRSPCMAAAPSLRIAAAARASSRWSRKPTAA